jgi:hypothetical protein
MEILDINYLNTTTLISVSSGTDTVSYLFDRNYKKQYESDVVQEVTIGVTFLLSKNISRIALQNHNFKKFTVYYNSNSANTFSLNNSPTSVSDWNSNSYTSNFLKFNTIAVDSIWIKASDVMGSDITINCAYPYLESLNSTTVVFIDDLNDTLRIYERDGVTWNLINDNYVLTSTIYQSITKLNNNTIALACGGSRFLQTFIWNSTDWTQSSNKYTITNGYPVIDALNSITIAYINTDRMLRTYTLTGTNWTQTGNAYSMASGFVGSSITKMNSITVAIADEGYNRLGVYSWNGTNWTQTGNFYTIPTMYQPRIEAKDSTTIIFLHGLSGGMLSLYTWDGTNFTIAGSSYSITSSTYRDPAITLLNSNLIATIDDIGQTLRLFYYSSPSWQNYSIAPKLLGELWINDVKFQFENNPTAKGYKPKLNVKESTHELSDGGIVKYVFGKSFESRIDLEYQSREMYDNFFDLYNNKESFVFVPFPTGTAWKGKDIYEVNWIGNFNFLELFNNEWASEKYNGQFVLREIPK